LAGSRSKDIKSNRPCFLISSEKKELIEDVRTMKGPNIDSDHYLLKITLNQKLPKIYIKKNRD